MAAIAGEDEKREGVMDSIQALLDFWSSVMRCLFVMTLTRKVGEEEVEED